MFNPYLLYILGGMYIHTTTSNLPCAALSIVLHSTTTAAVVQYSALSVPVPASAPSSSLTLSQFLSAAIVAAISAA